MTNAVRTKEEAITMPLATQKTSNNLSEAQRRVNKAVENWFYSSTYNVEELVELSAAWAEFERLTRQFGAEIGIKGDES